METILITQDDFDIAGEYEALKQAGVGAVVIFSGVVRDNADNPRLLAMTLEHYPGMTEMEISTIIEEAKGRWPLASVRVIHRVGRLLPEENIVFVGTASAHRQAAFESAAFIMDYLKTKAPFWKKEETEQGANWVDARETDEDALRRWE
ncbi:MAG: Molybdopterin synthase catalytic subunit [Rhodospirillaceae bacterium]|nr:MAG: Molybdopterin synthase catalytic subunit [Rhodospirillaceae bacterium]